MQTLHVVFHAAYSGARRTADCVRLQDRSATWKKNLLEENE